MSYLDKRSRKVLSQIVDNPSVTGKELQDTLSLSRKQLSYSLEKVNGYLLDHGFSKIQRLKTGYLMVPLPVIEAFRTVEFSAKPSQYIYSSEERQDIIVLLLMCRQDPLSAIDFSQELNVSKNTFVLDLKKLQPLLHTNFNVRIIYTRKEGYRMIGGEYEKRCSLIASIRKVLLMSDGETIIHKICKITDHEIQNISLDISEIEKKLNVQFTDERLKELPYILCLVIRRIKQGKFLETIPESFQHIMGTHEYSAVSNLTQRYGINHHLDHMFLTAQIQISNVHSTKREDIEVERQIADAAKQMIKRFEEVSLTQLNDKNELLGTLIQHCKPAYYRMKYQFHIENSAIDLVLPQHEKLHELVRISSKPFADLLGYEIVDEELVFFTILFGAWLKRQGTLHILEPQKKAILVCSNGVTVSNYLYATLSELFPEIIFIDSMSIRDFEEYRQSYDIIFSTVRVESDKPQYLVPPFTNESSKERFRDNVLHEVTGINSHRITINDIIDIIENHARIEDEAKLKRNLQRYLFQPSILQKNSMIKLTDLLNLTTVQISTENLYWKDAIILASKPLIENRKIENSYVNAMIYNIEHEQHYIEVADGVAIAHAGIDKGVNQVSMGLLKLPQRIMIGDYACADIIVVLATPNKEQHLTALYDLIEITESWHKLEEIRKSNTVQQILNVFS